MAALRAAASAVGGTASIWRHPAALSARVADAFHPLADVNLRIQQALKRQFDPAGIFNPARMFASF
jgi:glycolate oxidase FAD binding subunit